MIIHASPDAIERAGRLIKAGGLVALPTETVYGLGADALNVSAVAKIFAVKGRPAFDPLIVHIAELEWLTKLATSVDKRAIKLIQHCWPGPLTIVLKRSSLVPDIVTSGLDTVAIRMPAHPVALALLRKANTPIAAPSANLFGKLSPTQAMHVHKQLGNSVDIILDGGQCAIGVESTIISFVQETPIVLRPGGLPIEKIESIIGTVHKRSNSKKIQSPGQLSSHYAPKTPLKLIQSLEEIPVQHNIGVLLFTEPETTVRASVIEILSKEGDIATAAMNLFAALHRLDESGVDTIYAERIPQIGLGLAIADRMQRASWNTNHNIL